ncbi:uncharacterized protein LOC115769310 isoform X2 [Drosophila novamexicana]|uniref:Uncharacterized protein n=1 Tax=Drosophila virilis TaxID=7244 RepID=B4M8M2_DROVI|nr:uncharacterized protein LOC6633967 [Drosophila virilis]XP_030569900.1 uncharacterized protein LOC115769310 isoform X2 [Drosophila novamexicana]EDW57548.2 uncharacterized protein Dvir_GJ18084 [Drosophila virilis]
MLFKYFPLILLMAQCLLAAPTADSATAANKPGDLTQKQLEQEAHNETINLLNALFRAQIAYFSGVRDKLAPSTKRARDIELYVTRLNEAIAEKELDKKDAMWLNIFEQFNKSPLLLNRQEETGLSNDDYQALLTDKKLQEITTSFVRDVTTYFLKMAQFSGKVVEMSIDEYRST